MDTITQYISSHTHSKSNGHQILNCKLYMWIISVLCITNTHTNKTKVCTMNANKKYGDKIKGIPAKHLFEVNALLIGVCGNPSDWKPPVWRLSWVGTGVNATKIKPNVIQDFLRFFHILAVWEFSSVAGRGGFQKGKLVLTDCRLAPPTPQSQPLSQRSSAEVCISSDGRQVALSRRIVGRKSGSISCVACSLDPLLTTRLPDQCSGRLFEKENHNLY